MTTILQAAAGRNVIYGMGMLEMGMTMSYEQLLIDAEIIRMTRKVLEGIDVNEATLAADLIKAVGPNGSYLSQKHTRAHMRGISQARLIDRRMYEAWEREGGTDISERARQAAIEILETHRVEPLPGPVRKELDGIIAEARAELAERSGVTA
jgi:trimethylamine--corrinoid protein Co-methyltransferase